MRSEQLSIIRGGINRLREKGRANREHLFDLVNGYVDIDGTARARPGTVRVHELDERTRGLAALNGRLVTFCHEIVDVPADVDLLVLLHPAVRDEDDELIPLKAVHFAKPFMGFLYVVAEFEESPGHGLGEIFHYWLQSGGEWQPETTYRAGDLVVPSTPNGFAYEAVRLGDPYPSWAPNVPRSEGDRIEPTEYNDFFYEVVSTVGSNPTSGSDEPIWPTDEGAQVFEDTEGVAATPTKTTSPPPANQPAPFIRDRFLGGGGEIP